jgi:periplasmic divalent cation tolerance protein
MVFIYTTCASDDEAKKLSKILIEGKHAACIDYWPVSSIYRWDGQIVKMSHVILMVSTFEKQLADVEDLISHNHSYSVPLIAGVDVRRINRPYKEWMTSEVN